MLAHHARIKEIQAANKKSEETESFGMGTLPRKILKEMLSKAVQPPKVRLEIDHFVSRAPFFVKNSDKNGAARFTRFSPTSTSYIFRTRNLTQANDSDSESLIAGLRKYVATFIPSPVLVIIHDAKNGKLSFSISQNVGTYNFSPKKPLLMRPSLRHVDFNSTCGPGQ